MASQVAPDPSASSWARVVEKSSEGRSFKLDFFEPRSVGGRVIVELPADVVDEGAFPLELNPGGPLRGEETPIPSGQLHCQEDLVQGRSLPSLGTRAWLLFLLFLFHGYDESSD